MFRNYIKTAWRNIRKNRLFSFINILGLAIGIATFFVIMLYVQDELSYDRFNEKADRIARIIFQADVNGGKINESVTMAPVAQTLMKDFAEVEDATRIINQGQPKVNYNGKIFKGERLAMADPNVFDIFTLPLVEGDPGTALLQPNTIVINETTARKYFSGENAIGKMLSINADTVLYKVTGVMQDIPVNSHFYFDMLGSMTGYEDAKSDSWMFGGFHTYLLLGTGTDLKKVEARFPEMVAKYMGPQIQQQMGLSFDQFVTKGNKLGFVLQPLTEIHLNSHTTTEFEPGGNATYVYVFAGIAAFMLIVACINFVNLSTAGASKRAKEVGVRKVAGSGKGQLVSQFLSESMLIAVFAMAIAYILLQLMLPMFNNISEKELTLSLKPAIAFVGLGVVVGLLAGIYPAFYLSSFKPIAVLKGRVTSAHKSFGLRSGLVVFQFFISVGLIIGTIVVYQQMKFIQNKDVGYNKSQIITIPNSYLLGKNENVFKQQLLADKRITNATLSWYKPAGPSNYNNAIAYPLGDNKTIVNGVDYHIDEQFIPTLEIKMSSGRNFSKDFGTDSSAIILNETAAQALGWTPETAIGKTVVRQNSAKGNNFNFHVIGVVRNFNFKSLHESISPLFMTWHPEGGLMFKINTTDVEGLLTTMKQQWDTYQVEEPFTYAFLDDLFNKTYAAEQKTATLMNIFAVLIILVSCLGLFGLATYTAEQRTKEIGIRKVLGASVSQVTQMLSKEFLKLVLIASCIAFPIAWWGANKWLQSFAYRVDISWWIFVVAALIALSIALFTVSFQAIKAAIANPVKALKAE